MKKIFTILYRIFAYALPCSLPFLRGAASGMEEAELPETDKRRVGWLYRTRKGGFSKGLCRLKTDIRIFNSYEWVESILVLPFKLFAVF